MSLSSSMSSSSAAEKEEEEEEEQEEEEKDDERDGGAVPLQDISTALSKILDRPSSSSPHTHTHTIETRTTTSSGHSIGAMLAFHRIATAAGVVLSSGCDVATWPGVPGDPRFAGRIPPARGCAHCLHATDSCIVAGTSGDSPGRSTPKAAAAGTAPSTTWRKRPRDVPNGASLGGHRGGWFFVFEFPVDALACERTRRQSPRPAQGFLG